MRRRRRNSVFTAGEIRLVLLGGIFAGLAFALAPPSITDLVIPVETGGPVEAMLADPALSRSMAADPRPVRIGEKDMLHHRREKDRIADVDRPEAATARPTVADSSMVRIIDGDTFYYGGEKIRIADIDTPEVRGRCAYETQLAARATRRMDELLRQGPFELQPIGEDEDRYGRKLRVVTRGGRSLGDQLVSEGLARTWTGRREPWCA
jgi:endonuclease YncB( thermonuclease family)